MHDLAREITQTLRGGEVLLLEGELGAGKTTFTQGLAIALGITEPIISPTFTIIADYPAHHPFLKHVIHVDLYRLTSAPIEEEPAVAEVLQNIHEPGQLTVIEWADKLTRPLSAPWLSLRFAHGQTPTQRVVTIERNP